MKVLLLMNLSLRNFRGVKKEDISLGGKDLSICAANKLGKTTCGDAITWLLFGKDMMGRSEKIFKIKTINEDGSEVHKLNHSVKADFTYDGVAITLEKILKEEYVKKRGEAKKTFTGHVTEYRIDGLKTTAGKYKDAVANIAEEKTFRLLTVPLHFSEGMKWEDRRDIIIDVCGDVSDEDIILGNKKLAGLPEILNGKKAEAYLPELKEKRRNLNSQIDEIPTRVDENNRKAPDISGIAQKEQSAALVRYNQELGTKGQTLLGLDSGGVSPELTQSLLDIKGKINDHEIDAKNLAADALRKKREELSELQQTHNTAVLEVETSKTSLVTLEKSFTETENKIDVLRKDFKEIAGEVCTPVEGLCCDSSACMQVIPTEIQTETFERVKKERTDKINVDGSALKDELAGIGDKVSSLKADIIGQSKVVENTATAVNTCTEAIKPMETAEPVVTGAHASDISEKERIEASIESSKSGDVSGIKTKLDEEIEAITIKRDAAVADLNLVTEFNKVEERRKELAAEEDTITAKFEKNEEELFLIEEFIKAKVYSLGVKVAEKFGDIKFKLFKTAINGGVEPCCEVLVNGVPFAAANNAARINTGLEVINVLSEFYDNSLPVVVDNSEAVNKLEKSGSQMIKLVVTTDKKLTFVK